jgi:hypothetical protein
VLGQQSILVAEAELQLIRQLLQLQVVAALLDHTAMGTLRQVQQTHLVPERLETQVMAVLRVLPELNLEQSALVAAEMENQQTEITQPLDLQTQVVAVVDRLNLAAKQADQA